MLTSSGRPRQSRGADIQCRGHCSASGSRNRAGSTVGPPSAPPDASAASADIGTLRRSRTARERAMFASTRSSQVFTLDRCSNRSSPFSRASQVSCTTSSATDRVPT